MTLPLQKFDFDTCTQVSDQNRILVKKVKKKKKEKTKFLPTYLP